ncbi:MAG: sulfurtransferase TusA family protein [Candidatus Omnitrophica bacterium]|nr:sulfurtransferase TusA family protein [Candidatus Omnitrophota bacterium]
MKLKWRLSAMGSYEIPAGLTGEIKDFSCLINEFKNGRVAAKEFKAIRVPFGMYEQREEGTYMIRIRCAAGIITPGELGHIASLAARYGDGTIHITTRQEPQLHYVKLEDAPKIMEELIGLGLSSRGGGGNTVRNITVSEDAGVDPYEVFDVTPYAVALTSRFIAEPDSWTLPRKFKFAFSGSGADKGLSTVSDLGFIARVDGNGRKGFKVYAAGGMGARSSAGKLLLEFIPDTEVYNAAKAAKELFWKHGNRRNKHAARLRFLWDSLGEAEFRRLFGEEYSRVKERAYQPLDVKETGETSRVPDIAAEGPGNAADFALWKDRFVSMQKRKGFMSVTLPVEFGFLGHEHASGLAGFISVFGDDTVRFTRDQNIRLRNIPEKYLGNLYNFLIKSGVSFNRPQVLDGIVSCAGASTCQLGICLSRGAAKAVINKLENSGLDLDGLKGLKINISGCPNSCGQHPVADLGFSGKVLRKNGRMYPAYKISGGAVINDVGTKLAGDLGEVSSRDLPSIAADILGAYLLDADRAKGFQGFIAGSGKKEIERLCAKYAEIPEFEEDRNYYYDWGAKEPFSLATRGSGECSAGVSDLIEVDMDNIARLQKEILSLERTAPGARRGELARELIFYSSRALLVTRGVDERAEKGVFGEFIEHFIDSGLVSGSYRDILCEASRNDAGSLAGKAEEALSLAERVKYLYGAMDSSFSFDAASRVQAAGDIARPGVSRDLRGVACPMNFVKTKMELSKLNPGDTLEILLDDGSPIENVPGSVKAEGHEIVASEKKNGYWSLLIRKKA